MVPRKGKLEWNRPFTVIRAIFRRKIKSRNLIDCSLLWETCLLEFGKREFIAAVLSILHPILNVYTAFFKSGGDFDEMQPLKIMRNDSNVVS